MSTSGEPSRPAAEPSLSSLDRTLALDEVEQARLALLELETEEGAPLVGRIVDLLDGAIERLAEPGRAPGGEL